MVGEQVDISHEEVWDDSALINSWNEALAEYKKYHSIHVKGGSVRDLSTKISHQDSEAESNIPASRENPTSTSNEDPDAIVGDSNS
ncbi:hypothetical protein ED733_007350 [Metarhizium rileyi]|uniref:Survival Motor Neuron Gemin2-binding domain-containing protein n=1 Tax=Metarhizium rileyi (strain RCEF 4871) TaxID=1649241 RepID=A0A5C6GFL1_METRR|nr:hypothetical protein ED733_007350 [Metarhizium rileyi]